MRFQTVFRIGAVSFCRHAALTVSDSQTIVAWPLSMGPSCGALFLVRTQHIAQSRSSWLRYWHRPRSTLKRLPHSVWVVSSRACFTAWSPRWHGITRHLLLPFIGSAKTDPVRFKWGFGEVLLKDKFAFKSLIKVLYLRGENCLQNAHFYKQKGPCLKTPLNWTGSVFLLLILGVEKRLT